MNNSPQGPLTPLPLSLSLSLPFLSPPFSHPEWLSVIFFFFLSPPPVISLCVWRKWQHMLHWIRLREAEREREIELQRVERLKRNIRAIRSEIRCKAEKQNEYQVDKNEKWPCVCKGGASMRGKVLLNKVYQPTESCYQEKQNKYTQLNHSANVQGGININNWASEWCLDACQRTHLQSCLDSGAGGYVWYFSVTLYAWVLEETYQFFP